MGGERGDEGIAPYRADFGLYEVGRAEFRRSDKPHGVELVGTDVLGGPPRFVRMRGTFRRSFDCAQDDTPWSGRVNSACIDAGFVV